jgi:hypothetical protein
MANLGIAKQTRFYQSIYPPSSISNLLFFGCLEVLLPTREPGGLKNMDAKWEDEGDISTVGEVRIPPHTHQVTTVNWKSHSLIDIHLLIASIIIE